MTIDPAALLENVHQTVTARTQCEATRDTERLRTQMLADESMWMLGTIDHDAINDLMNKALAHFESTQPVTIGPYPTWAHAANHIHTPPPARIRYTPAAYATMRGLTPQAAEIITDMARHLTGT